MYIHTQTAIKDAVSANNPHIQKTPPLMHRLSKYGIVNCTVFSTCLLWHSSLITLSLACLPPSLPLSPLSSLLSPSSSLPPSLPLPKPTHISDPDAMYCDCVNSAQHIVSVVGSRGTGPGGGLPLPSPGPPVAETNHHLQCNISSIMYRHWTH